MAGDGLILASYTSFASVQTEHSDLGQCSRHVRVNRFEVNVSYFGLAGCGFMLRILISF